MSVCLPCQKFGSTFYSLTCCAVPVHSPNFCTWIWILKHWRTVSTLPTPTPPSPHTLGSNDRGWEVGGPEGRNICNVRCSYLACQLELLAISTFRWHQRWSLSDLDFDPKDLPGAMVFFKQLLLFLVGKAVPLRWPCFYFKTVIAPFCVTKLLLLRI